MRSYKLINSRLSGQLSRGVVCFIDIDGTLTDGTHREKIMEERGLVVGNYGDPNRTYPKGKQAFLEAFANPLLFSKDTTMINAIEMLELFANQGHICPIQVFFVTARDSLYHTETVADLCSRGLWKKGSRLVCKPHNQAPTTVTYKVTTMANIVSALRPEVIVLVDNSIEILKGAKIALPAANTFTNCTDALNWWKGYAKIH